jgi:hypothetical protein
VDYPSHPRIRPLPGQEDMVSKWKLTDVKILPRSSCHQDSTKTRCSATLITNLPRMIVNSPNLALSVYTLSPKLVAKNVVPEVLDDAVKAMEVAHALDIRIPFKPVWGDLM